MQVTVIGAGNMGSSFVKQLSLAGHQVRVTARDLGKAQQLAQAHANVQAVPAEQAPLALTLSSWQRAMKPLFPP